MESYMTKWIVLSNMIMKAGDKQVTWYLFNPKHFWKTMPEIHSTY
jgi:hypothetical protein